MVAQLLAKAQAYCQTFDDFKDVVFEEKVTKNAKMRSPISEDQHSSPKQQNSTLNSAKNEELSGGSNSENQVRTPKKKTHTSLTMNLDKDSNSKRFANHFKLDPEEGSNSQPKTMKKLILLNFDCILDYSDKKPTEDDKNEVDHNMAQAIARRTKSNLLKASIMSEESSFNGGEGRGSTSDRFRPKYIEDKKDDSSYCNPCALL